MGTHDSGFGIRLWVIRCIAKYYNNGPNVTVFNFDQVGNIISAATKDHFDVRVLSYLIKTRKNSQKQYNELSKDYMAQAKSDIKRFLPGQIGLFLYC